MGRSYWGGVGGEELVERSWWEGVGREELGLLTSSCRVIRVKMPLREIASSFQSSLE